MAEFKNIVSEYDVTKKTLKSSCKFKVADSVGVRRQAVFGVSSANLIPC